VSGVRRNVRLNAFGPGQFVCNAALRWLALRTVTQGGIPRFARPMFMCAGGDKEIALLKQELDEMRTKARQLEQESKTMKRSLKSLHAIVGAVRDSGVLGMVSHGNGGTWLHDAGALEASRRALKAISTYVAAAYHRLAMDESRKGSVQQGEPEAFIQVGAERSATRAHPRGKFSVFPCEHCRKKFVSFPMLLGHHRRRHSHLPEPSIPAYLDSSSRPAESPGGVQEIILQIREALLSPGGALRPGSPQWSRMRPVDSSGWILSEGVAQASVPPATSRSSSALVTSDAKADAEEDRQAL